VGKDRTRLPQLKDASLTLEERVATLTFLRNDVRNALTGTELVADIVSTIQWANANEEVSVLILTGEGSAFSAGGNLKQMRQRSGTFSGTIYEIQRQYRLGIQNIALSMHSAEIPLIAAVNGPAIGAGFDLACMCDLRLGTPETVMGETFINLGLIPGDGGGWFLQRLIGYQRAAELTFTGRLVDAAEAKEIGLLLEVVKPEQLQPRAQALAAQIAAKPPLALRLAKRLMKAAQRQELADFLDLCACFQGLCHDTKDHMEALEAFVEKRTGKFTGE
jgi:enoyl-CoA hydratase/carnithine racemase